MAAILQVARGTEYAIAALKELAKLPPESCLRAEEVANRAGIPAKFTANILSTLVKHNLAVSGVCAGRGYCLAPRGSEISVLEVITAMEGSLDKPFCFLDRTRNCNPDDPCAMHEFWTEVRGLIEARLTSITIQHLIDYDLLNSHGEEHAQTQ